MWYFPTIKILHSHERTLHISLLQEIKRKAELPLQHMVPPPSAPHLHKNWELLAQGVNVVIVQSWYSNFIFLNTFISAVQWLSLPSRHSSQLTRNVLPTEQLPQHKIWHLNLNHRKMQVGTEFYIIIFSCLLHLIKTFFLNFSSSSFKQRRHHLFDAVAKIASVLYKFHILKINS